MSGIGKSVLSVGLIVGALAVSACESRYATRGNLPDPDLLASIEPGATSRDEVAQLLGSPSSVAMFERETWFYISQKSETFAFLEPDIYERQVVIIKFDQGGVLENVETLRLEDSQTVVPTERETPTLGNDPSLFDQFFGNLGRFNKE